MDYRTHQRRLLPLLAGEMHRAQGLRIGYFAQHQVEMLRLDRSVVDEFRSSVPEKQGRNLRTQYSGEIAQRSSQLNVSDLLKLGTK